MAQDDFLGGDDDEGESGAGLRKKLEAALKANRTLTATNLAYQARDLIVTKGFKYVKPEDLTSAEPGKLEEFATTLEAQRRVERLGVARDLLKAKGHPDDDLDALAEQFRATLMAVIGQALLGEGGADDGDAEDGDFTMIDLSAAVLDDDE